MRRCGGVGGWCVAMGAEGVLTSISLIAHTCTVHVVTLYMYSIDWMYM